MRRGWFPHTHTLLDTAGYKRRPPNLATVKNECSDVLFIVLRLAGYCDLQLPDTLPALPDGERPITMEGVDLELSGLAGEVAAHISGQKSISLLETLLRMAILVEWIAAHHRFSLSAAYFAELSVCRLWQMKNLTPSRWQQRLSCWLGKAR